jgi:[acyl-carrier-protein] S-malonyltransferase
MEVYRVGSEASGLDLQKLCFDSPLEDLVETEVQQPALVATSLAILAAIRAEGIEPDVVVGHSVGEFSALAAVNALETGEAIGPRARARARHGGGGRRHPGSMAAILGLDDEEVEKLCRKIVGVWPANYNCPGQIVISGENDAVRSCAPRPRTSAPEEPSSSRCQAPSTARSSPGRRIGSSPRSTPSASTTPSRRSCRP